jgi:hypothetical protein
VKERKQLLKEISNLTLLLSEERKRNAYLECQNYELQNSAENKQQLFKSKELGLCDATKLKIHVELNKDHSKIQDLQLKLVRKEDAYCVHKSYLAEVSNFSLFFKHTFSN